MIQIHPDWKEWLALLSSHQVEYLIIGGVAFSYHAIPRFTGDLDILVRPSVENGEKIVRALEKFGFGSLQAKAESFTTPDRMLALGNEPVRIEIFTSIPGVAFQDAWPRKVESVIDGIRVGLLSWDDLMAAKLATARPQDLADIDAMKKIRSANRR